MATVKRLSIPLDEKQHQRIKLSALLHHQSIKDYVLDRLFSDNTPNETTLRAMRELEEGKNLSRAKNTSEMLDDILKDK